MQIQINIRSVINEIANGGCSPSHAALINQFFTHLEMLVGNEIHIQKFADLYGIKDY